MLTCYRACAEEDSASQALTYPLQKGGQPPGFEPPVGGREVKQKGNLAGPKGSRTGKSREVEVGTPPGPKTGKCSATWELAEMTSLSSSVWWSRLTERQGVCSPFSSF